MSENIEKYSRQIFVFGREGQQLISDTKVGIVGLGGIGSIVAQLLTYLGVQKFILVDDDLVEESNLNRLIGATINDVQNRIPKIEIAKRLITSINPIASVAGLAKNLRTEEALNILCNEPKIIFGCVDNDSTRLILTELTSAWEKTLIDCGTEIINNEKYKEFGGRVIVARPGDFCLLCAGEIDLEVAKQELESMEEKNYRQTHGYGLGKNTPDPSVISLNGVIAGVAVTEFLMLITGLREPNRKVTYRGMRGVFRGSLDKKRGDCLICNSIVGKRELVDIKRYIKEGLPKDLPI